MSVTERIASCKLELERLKQGIEAAKSRLNDGGLSNVLAPRRPLGPAPKKRKVLEGHFGKVYALDWACDSEHLVSAR
jgi:guanine nucleotide-binding protein G(I)/G(S)/G(T) subunit beta-1